MDCLDIAKYYNFQYFFLLSLSTCMRFEANSIKTKYCRNRSHICYCILLLDIRVQCFSIFFTCFMSFSIPPFHSFEFHQILFILLNSIEKKTRLLQQQKVQMRKVFSRKLQILHRWLSRYGHRVDSDRFEWFELHGRNMSSWMVESIENVHVDFNLIVQWLSSRTTVSSSPHRR